MRSCAITSKGQVTIPRSVREALSLRERDKVIFVVEGNVAIMRPLRVRPLTQLRGFAKGLAPYPGREVEREAARQHVAQHSASVDDPRE